MQFFQAVSWMWTPFPRLGAVVGGLCELLETLLGRPGPEAKHVWRALSASQQEEWVTEYRVVWDTAKETLENAWTLVYPRSR